MSRDGEASIVVQERKICSVEWEWKADDRVDRNPTKKRFPEISSERFSS